MNTRNQHDGFIHNADGSREDAETSQKVGGVNNYHQSSEAEADEDGDEGMGPYDQEEIAQAKIKARMLKRNAFDGLIHNPDGSREEADTYNKIGGANNYIQKMVRADPPSEPVNKTVEAESIEEVDRKAKEVEKAEREIKIREEAKWENKRWNETWSDGLRHGKDGRRWNEATNGTVEGVNNYAQSGGFGRNTGKSVQQHQEIDVETLSEKASRDSEVQSANQLQKKHEQDKEDKKKQILQ